MNVGYGSAWTVDFGVTYFVYVLLCEDGSFYTGYAGNLKTRIKQHLTGKGARYTRLHKPKKLVYVEEFATRSEAMRRERMIKRLSHGEKQKLVRTKHK
ncbi:MAG: GIY-YIG nuclease family protein [Candidatus Bathyarchaeia archaeon]